MSYTFIGNKVSLGFSLFSVAGSVETIISKKGIKSKVDKSSFEELKPILIKVKKDKRNMFKVIY